MRLSTLTIIFLFIIIALMAAGKYFDHDHIVRLYAEKDNLEAKNSALEANNKEIRRQRCSWKSATKEMKFQKEIGIGSFVSVETPADLKEALRQAFVRETGSQGKDITIQFLQIDLKNAKAKVDQLEKENIELKERLKRAEPK